MTTVSVWFVLGYRESKYLLPPGGVDTLAGLASIPPPTRRLSITEDQGARYFVWIGRTGKVLLASGPPVYVFDASGRLVGRSADIGDSGDYRLRRLFELGLRGREVSFEEALNLVRK
jgi:hypothetical protein